MNTALIHVHGSAQEDNTAVIDISENTGVTNGLLTVAYDTSKASFVSAEPGENFSDIIIAANESEQGFIKIAFVSGERITAGGDMIKLRFKPVASGECTLSASVSEFSEITPSDVRIDIPFSEIRDTMTVSLESTEPDNDKFAGDINDDGCINSGDFVFLIKKLLGEETPEYDAAYDINNDGSVNSEDLLTLRTILMQ